MGMQEITSPEVAELLGVSQEQFSKFWQVCQRYPKLFPGPARIIGRNYIWDRTQIEQWKAENTF
jgi:predicted DNA-binding transcriptional regulator AlpA